MIDFLEKLLREFLEISEVDDYEPSDPPGQLDHVVGTLSPEMQMSFKRIKTYSDNLSEKVLAVTSMSGQEYNESNQDVIAMWHNCELLEHVFWISCRQTYPILLGKPSICIRQGWVIAWIDSTEQLHGEFEAGEYNHMADYSSLQIVVETEPQEVAIPPGVTVH